MKAPAKINLTLGVFEKRADGYHEISSIMRALCLFDDVEVALFACENGSPAAPEIIARADAPGVPEGPANLAYKAAELMLSMFPGDIERIEISLKKNIPAAAGLGGGSTDAAIVLLYLAKALAPEAKLPEIASWGTELGMDVPFCVYACAAANPELGYGGAGSALAEGAGERLTIIEDMQKALVVLVKPQAEILAKQAYDLYDLWDSRDHGSDNDLEAPLAEAWPIVAETLTALKTICAEEGAGGVKVQLTGSGPTVFAYFEAREKDEAGRVYARAKNVFGDAFVCLAETL